MTEETFNETRERFIEATVRFLFEIREKYDAASFTDPRVRMQFEVLARNFALDFWDDVSLAGGFELAEKAVQEIIAAEDTLKK